MIPMQPVSGLNIKGEMSASEDITFEGTFEGSIDLPQHRFIAGKNARVNASVSAKTVSIDGHIDGHITADVVDSRPTAVVNGSIVSPKLSVLFHADPQVTLFANAGSGFHSNDARAAVQDSRKALARAIGGETGIRMKPHPRARISADVWYLALSSEQVSCRTKRGCAANRANRVTTSGAIRRRIRGLTG